MISPELLQTTCEEVGRIAAEFLDRAFLRPRHWIHCSKLAEELSAQAAQAGVTLTVEGGPRDGYRATLRRGDIETMAWADAQSLAVARACLRFHRKVNGAEVAIPCAEAL